LENAVAIAVLGVMTALPLLEIVGRTSGRSVPGSIVLVQHLTLWIAVVGAMLAARSERLLSLPTLRFFSDRWRAPFEIITSGLAAGVTATLLLASLDLVRIERTAGDIVAWGIPSWVILAVLPVGFAVIAGRLIWHAAANPRGRLLTALGLAIPLLFRSIPQLMDTSVLLPGCLMIVAATAFGLPIFVAIGGAALLLFWVDGTPINAVPGETYRLTTSPMLPAVPLFALSGYLLAEGDASRRLTRLFTALFGWLPGGLALVTTAVLAFFTPLTGASGVTIVSMGGLLFPVLVQARHAERTSLGLVTVSGSIGLLFFPSLPVFLYGFYANQPFERLFLAGLVPGVLLVVGVAAWAAIHGAVGGATRTKFQSREAVRAIWHAKWELALPIVVLGSIITGWATLIEAAAITVAYAFVVECFVHRALHVSRDGRRLHDHSERGVGFYQLPDHCRDTHQSALVGARPRRIAHDVSAGAEHLSRRRGRDDGYLFGHHRCRAAHHAHCRSLRNRSRPPGDHLSCKHGVGIFDAADGREPVLVVVPLQAIPTRGLSIDAAVHRDSADHGAAHHVFPLAVVMAN
jgi:TRAP-type C4-dicarboxylate transport system permease small subunit